MGKPISADDLFGIVKEGQPTREAAPISSKNFSEAMKNAPKDETMPWTDVIAQAYTNIPKSAKEFGEGIVEAVTHPKETVKSVWDIAAGGLHNVTPNQIADWIDKHEKNPEAIKRAIESANALGRFYKERYGSGEGFKKALASDPVGVASDVSAFLSGGAGMASKVGMPAKVVGAVEKAAEMTNPITAPLKATKEIGKAILGGLTGTGSETISGAAKAGFQGDKNLVSHLRGKAPITEPLENARHNLNVMRENRSNKYRSGMTDISADKTVLDFNDIEKSIEKAKQEISYKGKIKDDIANDWLQKVEDEVKDWKESHPETYHTPEGLDALKQRIGAISKRIPYEELNSNRVVGNVYNSIKNSISKQAPKYSEVMSDYAQASDSIQEIEKALSLGNRASADTALRKLQSLTRNNVNTNYGNRLNLAQQLEMEGGKPFISALHGQALSSNVARGLAGPLEAATLLSGIVNPVTLAAIPFQTPRLVGEGLYAGGRAAKGISKVGEYTGANPTRVNTLADILNAGKTQNEEQ
jgi:hypothetical protein